MKRSLLLSGLFFLLAASIAHGDEKSWTTVQRGLYLTRAGDCVACHTVDPEKPYAGNFSLETPFGDIYTANLTPDRQTGIGTWTPDDFFRAMTTGREKDGSRLYPAFPYTHFTIITREDSDAIFAYLQTLEPVNERVREPDFMWPLNWRFVTWGWNLINFEPQAFTPESNKPDEWNRGKYLVEGLAHCAMCHSPKNMLGAEKDGEDSFTGGDVEGWWAPSLTGDKRDGLGTWTKQQLVDFLKYGRNEKSAAFGPMADVIKHSTRHLRDEDLAAIAAYIKDLPARAQSEENANGEPVESSAQRVGAEIYAAQCSACHAPGGEGVPTMFAPLKGSALAQSANPLTIIRLILEGGQTAVSDKYPTPHAMPSFAWKLTDDEIAAVATYVRNSFGNRAPAVSAGEVAEIRSALDN
ncbi:MAG: c-type cytochrome [Rhizobiales bacterium]|nr:c-type cytochrome [Hyphomicrobiales bacterium]